MRSLFVILVLIGTAAVCYSAPPQPQPQPQPCGGFAEACCSGPSSGWCKSPSSACLRSCGNVGGVCSGFGGVFAFNGTSNLSANHFDWGCLSQLPASSPAAADAPQVSATPPPPVPTNGSYGCRAGFVPLCSPAPAGSGAVLCVCLSKGTPTTYDPQSDFGGAYFTAPTSVFSAAAPACKVPNPWTGACSCPTGMKVAGPLKPGPETDGSYLYFCLPSSSSSNSAAAAAAAAASSFFQKLAGSCSFPNPLTGKCTCPGTDCPQEALPGLFFCNREGAEEANAIAIGASTDFLGRVAESLIEDIGFNLSRTPFTLPDISGHDFKIEGMSFDYMNFTTLNFTFPKPNVLQVYLSGGVLRGKIARIEVKKV